jgi:hypothetical protein
LTCEVSETGLYNFQPVVLALERFLHSMVLSLGPKPRPFER